jgi:DNA-binding transcriptional MocR family regulator
LKYLGDIEVPQVTGGFFMGIWLPGIGDEEGFVKAAKAKGVNIASTNLYSPGWKKVLQEKHGGPFYRLTFPSIKSEDIELGIERIASAYKEMRSSVS